MRHYIRQRGPYRSVQYTICFTTLEQHIYFQKTKAHRLHEPLKIVLLIFMDFFKLFEAVVLPNSSSLPLVNEKLEHFTEHENFRIELS